MKLHRLSDQVVVFTNKDIAFAVFNYESKSIMSSDNFTLDNKTLELVKKAISEKELAGTLTPFSIFSDNADYGFYRKNNDHSYIIITKYSAHYFHNRYIEIIKSRLIEIFILFMILGLIFYFLSKTVFNPIRELSIASNLIRNNHDDQANIPENIQISEIDDLAQQLIALRAYKFDLMQARQSQERFFANMNHELRTPLNGILNFSSMMKDEMLGEISHDYKEMAVDIYQSGTYLLKLLDDILNFSNMDIGKVTLHKEEIDVIFEVREAIKLTIPNALVNINYEIKDNITKLEVDRKIFKQMLLEVLHNAAKFTSNGQINVTVFRQNRNVIIEIHDSGIGIKEEELEKLRKDFGQVGDGYSRGKKQGNGLGIFLVKKMMELHNGTFEIDSEFGKGTTVRLIF